jgi:hypothetical protein
MRRIQLGVGLLLVAAVVSVIVIQNSSRRAGAPTPSQPMAGASTLSQTEIEARAIAHAQRYGLGGSAPTSVASKQMTLGEFNTRFFPFRHDQADPSSLVWLVLIKGDVVVGNPPDMQGKPSSTRFDNIWVLLTPDGDIREWGAQTPGHELDFNATPITSRPTPVNPKYRSVPRTSWLARSVTQGRLN